MLFLKPIRCRECKERFWVRNPNAYFAAGAVLTIGAMLITAVWLVIEQNLGGPSIMAESKTETAQASPPGIDKSSPNMPEHLSSSTAPAKSLNSPPAAPAAKTPQQKRVDDHHFTVQLYQESAENGEADAQYKLGLLYLTGNGALQDFAEAAKWLRRAAEQGYALAQYELGLIYRTGYGLAIDHVQSYVWLNLAAAAGIPEAVSARDEVMRSLSNKQLAQAQKTAREWLASRVKRKTPGNAAAATEPETETSLQ
jgi:hypothetical protein